MRFEDFTAVVTCRAHPVDLLLRRTDDVRLGT
jgi:hypothetical protein